MKMVLSGDGADESFAGYHNYQYYNLVHRVQALPELFSNISCSVLDRFFDNSREGSLTSKCKRFLEKTRMDVPEQWIASRSQYLGQEKDCIYSQEFRERIRAEQDPGNLDVYFDRSKNWDSLNRFLFFDLKVYLADGVLVKVDRMSMANSLEVRSPFLDYRLAEFASRLHPQLKLKGLTTKYLIKKAMKDILPEDILYRKKQGFSVPLDKWFRVELINYAKNLLLDERSAISQYFVEGFVESLIREHSSGKKDNRHKIWSLLNLELWHRKNASI